MDPDGIEALRAESEILRGRIARLESALAAMPPPHPRPAPPSPEPSLEGTSRRHLLLALASGTIGGLAGGVAAEQLLDHDTTKSITTSVISTRPSRYRDATTGMYLPEGFGPMTNEETTRAAIQSAIDAAYADGGGAVLVAGSYTVGPNPKNSSYALYTRPSVGLVGAGWASSQIKLADSANAHVLSGQGLVDKNGQELGTPFVSIRELTLNGNRSAQSGDVTHHGLNAVRHPYLRLTGVRITNCDGNAYESTGYSLIDRNIVEVRPIWVTDLLCDNNNGWGLWSSSANREFHGKGIHVESNGMAGTNTYGGAFLDHSEDIILGLTARDNRGDGIFIHNVEACHYDNLHSFANDGYGIYVQGLVESEGRSWQASANCRALRPATYRPKDTTTAEVYFGDEAGSYGVSSDSRVDGIHAPGNKNFGGPKHADWGIYVADGNDASLQITNYVPGAGGLVGTIRNRK